MKNYKMNVNEYLSEEILGEVEAGIGDDFGFVPVEEGEANFGFVESIIPVGNEYKLIVRVENEFTGEKYTKEYELKKGTKLELNAFEMPLMCFLPPDKVPVLAEVVDVNETSVTMKIVGVEEEFADALDKKAESMQ